MNCTMFIGEKVKVELDDSHSPASFYWRKRKHVVKKVLALWHDWGFGAAAPSKKTWRLRHHRNYYRVETDTGEVFELYLDRGAGRRTWVLTQRLEPREHAGCPGLSLRPPTHR